GQVPSAWNPAALSDEARAALEAVTAAAATAAAESPKAWEEIRISDALERVWDVVERANEFVDRTKPWELGKHDDRREELATVLNALLETLRLVAVWSWPVMPAKCEALWEVLALPGWPGEVRDADAQPRYAGGDGRMLGETRILVPRIDLKSVTGA
ncbi:MAG: hypothetical protein ACKOC6_09380, partial [bacterium]